MVRLQYDLSGFAGGSRNARSRGCRVASSSLRQFPQDTCEEPSRPRVDDWNWLGWIAGFSKPFDPRECRQSRLAASFGSGDRLDRSTTPARPATNRRIAAIAGPSRTSFIRDGWSIKRLIREIVLDAARISLARRPSSEAITPPIPQISSSGGTPKRRMERGGTPRQCDARLFGELDLRQFPKVGPPITSCAWSRFAKDGPVVQAVPFGRGPMRAIAQRLLAAAPRGNTRPH